MVFDLVGHTPNLFVFHIKYQGLSVPSICLMGLFILCVVTAASLVLQYANIFGQLEPHYFLVYY